VIFAPKRGENPLFMDSIAFIFASNLYMKPFKFSRLISYFFQGMVILAPIVITAWTVITLFNLIDDILPNLLHVLVPDLVRLDPNGNPEKIPGLGFLVFVLLLLIVGYISSSFIVSKLVQWFDTILEKTPGIKIIYTTVKDFFEAFAGNKRKFTQPVLVSIEAPDVWRVGFITHDDLTEFGLSEYVSVYIPHSYAFSGITYLVKRDRIKMLSNISSADAMKFVLSGGVTDVGEEG
jgi:uncharacterized membrane protein